jgi:site-specific recombinase XerD
METLLRWFREYPAEGITAQDIERRFEKEKWSPATANRYRALLSLAYRLAIRNGKVKENPARLVRHRLEDNARIRFLSAEEESRLRTAIAVSCPEHLAELELALNTGVRLSEQYTIHWEDPFASRLVMAGVDIRTVQELLGHKTIAITVRYSHLAPEHNLAAVERLDSPQSSQPTLLPTPWL